MHDFKASVDGWNTDRPNMETSSVAAGKSKGINAEGQGGPEAARPHGTEAFNKESTDHGMGVSQMKTGGKHTRSLAAPL